MTSLSTSDEYCYPQTMKLSQSSSDMKTSTSTRAQRRGSRTTNACEACKKRKTKCSGPGPGPCEACRKVDTFCHFNMKLDTRRKLAYKPTAVRERQQYILEGVLQILKQSESHDVQDLLKMIRSEARPHQIATCLNRNLQRLQVRGVIAAVDLDDTDLVSLGLQGLFSHRAGRSHRPSSDEPYQSIKVSERMNPTQNATRVSNQNHSLHESRRETTANEDFHEVINRRSEGGTLPRLDTRFPMSQHSSESQNTVNSQFSRGSSIHSAGSADTLGTANIHTSASSPPVHLNSSPWSTSTDGSFDHERQNAAANNKWTQNELYATSSVPLPTFEKQQYNLQHMQDFSATQPRTALDQLCVAFRDNYSSLLAQGVPYEQISNYSKLDNEALYRHRMMNGGWEYSQMGMPG